MRNTPSGLAQRHERREAKRYLVPLRMEIWPEAHRRGTNPTFVFTRDLSIRGIYFLSETERQVDSRFNFAVIFLREMSGEDAELMKGLARTVRCERLENGEQSQFGIAAAIEKTTRLIGDGHRTGIPRHT